MLGLVSSIHVLWYRRVEDSSKAWPNALPTAGKLVDGRPSPTMTWRVGAGGSDVDRAAVDGEGGFLDGFVQGRVGVAGAGDVLRRRGKLHADDELGDQIARIRADDMGAEDAIRRLVGEDLDEAVGHGHGARPAIGHEGELANLIGDALGLQLLLGLPDGGGLRPGIDHAGNGVV